MKTVTVRDLGRVVTGHTPPTKKREYYGDFYPFVKPTDMIIGNKYTYHTEEGYSKLAYEKYNTSLIPKGSTCVVCIGTLGEKMTMAHCDLFTNQSVNSIIPNDEYDNHYVYYLLKYNLGKVKALNKGTASGREFVSKTTFLDMMILVHEDKKTQHKIGQILSAYDELIENNQKQIKLLEEAAQRLYKEWFVDLRFPGHENTPITDGIPEGWTLKTVSECLEMHIGGGWGKETPTGKNSIPAKVIRGTDINNIKSGDFSDVPLRYHSENDIKTRSLKSGDIIFELSNGNINNIGRSLLLDDLMLKRCGQNTICASFCKLFRPLDEQHSIILYLEIQEMQESGRMLPFKKQGSNGINNFAFDDFLQHKLIVPNTGFNMYPFVNIIKQISNLQSQFSLLIDARDRLLPKLMSGELEV
ncbi:MAG: restriction endonuclease subunit S [Clostridia bacterium]|nr:restriction endonuclease subunit S [Clostridia bacterium]